MTKLLWGLVWLTSAFYAHSQNVCSSEGNIVIFSNYDGGFLTIDVNEDIPNLKIGISSYEPSQVTITGTYAANVVEVLYAGFFPTQGTGNFHCDPTLSVGLVSAPNSPLASISYQSIPPVTLIETAQVELFPGYFVNVGNNLGILCAIQCSNDDSGGSNTANQVIDYFAAALGGSVRFMKTQYSCWCGSQDLTQPTNCCYEIPQSGGVVGIDLLPTAACQNLPATLTPNGVFSAYAWSTGATTSSITVAQAGTYLVTVSSFCGELTGAITVTGNSDDIEITGQVSDNICAGDALGSINTSISTSAVFTYQWIDNQGDTIGNLADIDNLAAGEYTVVATQTNGCTSSESFSIASPTPIVVAYEVVQPTCIQPQGVVTVSATNGVEPYIFTFNSGETGAVGPFEINAGMYSVSVTDGNGCTASAMGIEVFPIEDSIQVTILGPSMPLNPGDPFTLVAQFSSAIDSLTYYWSPTGLFACDTCPSVDAVASTDTTIVLTIATPGGCSSSDAFLIDIADPVLPPPTFYVPNAFSPDASGHNDLFQVYVSDPAVQVILFEVYDRTGNLLSNDINGWNGQFRGVPSPPAIYAWTARLLLPSGQRITEKGDVALFR